MNDFAHSTIPMSNEEFNFFRHKLFELAGISLSDGKVELLQSRLRSRVIGRGFSTFEQYRNFLSDIPRDHDEWEKFINQLTTNKTDWFREEEHFDFLLNDYLPFWKSLGKKHLSVWCAASSTGEEPYTLSMVLHKALQGSGITYEILATDIDTRVLTFAQNGVYPKAGLDLVPSEYHDYAFAMGTGEISQWMKVKKEIKKSVSFEQLNLTNVAQLNKKFDLIFCRNVLIYFNPQTILKVVEQMYNQTFNDSILVVAHSESLQNIQSKWNYVKPSIYKKGNHFNWSKN